MGSVIDELADQWRRFRRPFFARNSGADDSEELLDRFEQPAPADRTARSKPKLWTKSLILNILAIVSGTSFVSGFYLFALVRPFALHPDTNRNFLSSPIFYLHVLVHYASRISATLGLAAILGNKLGRRAMLMAGAAIGFVAVILGLISQLYSEFPRGYIWTVSTGLIGLQSGIGQVIAPAYLIEIAPLAIRGACGCFYEIAFWCGMLFAFISELEFSPLWLWTIVLAITALLYLFQFSMLWFGFESPHWLVLGAHKDDDALLTIQGLREVTLEEASRELFEIKASGNYHPMSMQDSNSFCSRCIGNRCTFCRHLCSVKVLRPIFLGSCLMAANLLTGAPIVYKIHTASLHKGDIIFEALISNKFHFTEILALILAVFYIAIMLAVALVFVDRIGRRCLVLVGIKLMVLSYFPMAVGAIYNSAIAWQIGSVVFMVAFSVGPGPIAPFLTAELFDFRTRLAATSICHLLTQIFPVYLIENYEVENTHYQSILMPIGALLGVVELVLLWLFLPETGRLNFDAIVAKFQVGQNWLQIHSNRILSSSDNGTNRSSTTVTFSNPHAEIGVAPHGDNGLVSFRMNEHRNESTRLVLDDDSDDANML